MTRLRPALALLGCAPAEPTFDPLARDDLLAFLRSLGPSPRAPSPSPAPGPSAIR